MINIRGSLIMHKLNSVTRPPKGESVQIFKNDGSLEYQVSAVPRASHGA